MPAKHSITPAFIQQNLDNEIGAVENFLTRGPLSTNIAAPTQAACIRLHRQYWGLPFSADYIVLDWHCDQPRNYDFVALYEQDPVENLFRHIWFAWVDQRPTDQRATSICYDPKKRYWAVYASVSGSRYRILAAIGPEADLSAIGSVKNADGFATRPHPEISPKDTDALFAVLGRETRNAILNSTEDRCSSGPRNIFSHDVFMVGQGLHTNIFNTGTDDLSTMLLGWTDPNSYDNWDQVIMYGSKPTNYDDVYVTWCWAMYHTVGFYETEVRFEKDKYWIGYATWDGSNYVFAGLKQSPKSHRTWMLDMRKIIGDVPLSKLAIPGTHDSASYSMFSSFGRPWTQTQWADFAEQLNDGIRYFDLRVGWYNPDFWMVHGTWSTWVKLSDLLTQVLDFLATNGEIVILDFNHFYDNTTGNESLSDDLHKKLVNQIGDALNSRKLLPNSYNLNTITPNGIWNAGARIILNYTATISGTKYDSYLFNVINANASWCNTDDKEALKNCCQNHVGTTHVGPWVLQLILTPQSSFPWSIQALANSLSFDANNWFRSWQDKVNIFIIDFYRGTDLVELAINANESKRPRSVDYQTYKPPLVKGASYR